MDPDSLKDKKKLDPDPHWFQHWPTRDDLLPERLLGYPDLDTNGLTPWIRIRTEIKSWIRNRIGFNTGHTRDGDLLPERLLGYPDPNTHGLTPWIRIRTGLAPMIRIRKEIKSWIRIRIDTNADPQQLRYYLSASLGILIWIRMD